MKRKYLRKCCDKFGETNKNTGRTFYVNFAKKIAKTCATNYTKKCATKMEMVRKWGENVAKNWAKKIENVVNMLRKFDE